MIVNVRVLVSRWVQIVWNRVVNHKVITRRMLGGVACAVVGTVFTVVFGASGGGCHSLGELESFWTRGAWWAYLTFSLVLAIAAVSVRRCGVLLLCHEATAPAPHNEC